MLFVVCCSGQSCILFCPEFTTTFASFCIDVWNATILPMCRRIGEAGIIEMKGRILLEHAAVDAQNLFATLRATCFRTDIGSYAAKCFHKEIRRTQRDAAELSSDDEEHLSADSLHLESAVDAFGNPIEFDGETVLQGKNHKSKSKHKPGVSSIPLGVDSFILLSPDPAVSDKIWLVQVKQVNPDPDDPATWVANANQKWHYFGGWWELTDEHTLGKIHKTLSLMGYVEAHACGKNTLIDWSNPAETEPLRVRSAHVHPPP
jgi:hypothetical protein